MILVYSHFRDLTLSLNLYSKKYAPYFRPFLPQGITFHLGKLGNEHTTVNLSYFYGDSICHLKTIVDSMISSSSLPSMTVGRMFSCQLQQFLRLKADLNAAQSTHKLHGFFLWKNTSFSFISIDFSGSSHCGFLISIRPDVSTWTIMWLAKQDIASPEESIQIKSEPFSVPPLKMTIQCASLNHSQQHEKIELALSL